MTVTPEMIARTTKSYEQIAKEPLKLEYIGGTLYAFGSELATLRLFRVMSNMRQGWSENMQTHYFAVEVA